MPIFSITITSEEHDALLKVARQERRNLRNQAAILLRDRLIELGLLPIENNSSNTVSVSISESIENR